MTIMIPDIFDPLRLRAAWAEALVFALSRCDRAEAAPICLAYLEDMETGGPRYDPFGAVYGDARLWAASAPPHELVAYTLAGLDHLPRAHLSGATAKRCFKAIWHRFSDADRAAFLAHVNGRRA